MKLRLVAVSLILFVAAWLPIIAQQSSAPQPDQPAATCCHGKDGSAHSMPCCEGKDAKDMPCCHKDAQDKQSAATCCDPKDGKGCCNKNAKQSAQNCCKGKDAKMCSKNGKDCCASPDCKSCCDKNTAASNTTNPNATTCCAGTNHACCHAKSNV